MPCTCDSENIDPECELLWIHGDTLYAAVSYELAEVYPPEDDRRAVRATDANEPPVTAWVPTHVEAMTAESTELGSRLHLLLLGRLLLARYRQQQEALE